MSGVRSNWLQELLEALLLLETVPARLGPPEGERGGGGGGGEEGEGEGEGKEEGKIEELFNELPMTSQPSHRPSTSQQIDREYIQIKVISPQVCNMIWPPAPLPWQPHYHDNPLP